DWVARLAPDQARAHLGPVLSPGQYAPNLKYGDANLDGIINVSDYTYIANVSVGFISMIDATNRDAVIAGNVRPVNGGTGGPKPAGVETPRRFPTPGRR